MTRQPRIDRLHALRRALFRAQAVGPFSIPLAAGLGSGFLASFVVDALLSRSVDAPFRQLLDAAVFMVVAAPAWLLVQRAAVRDAHDVLTWLNGWETERWQAEIGRRLPALPRSTPHLLDSLPDTIGLRPLRIELLAIAGAVDEAHERLERLPADTPWQRFERAALHEWLAFLGDAPERIGPMEDAAGEVDEQERRLVARAMVAAARARRAAVSGGDAVTPLAALRDELGHRPRRYAFPYWGGVVLMVGLIGLVASAAVTVAAAIIR